jgi:hypothetical protein
LHSSHITALAVMLSMDPGSMMIRNWYLILVRRALFLIWTVALVLILERRVRVLIQTSALAMLVQIFQAQLLPTLLSATCGPLKKTLQKIPWERQVLINPSIELVLHVEYVFVKNSICNKDMPECAKFVPTTVAYGEPCFVHYWRVATGSFWWFHCALAPIE